jgi:hypothetical protein
MDLNKPYFVSAMLPSVKEPLSMVAKRVITLMASVSTIDSLMTDWFYQAADGTRPPLPSDAIQLERIIYETSCLDGALEPGDHFFFGVGTMPDTEGLHGSRMNMVMMAGGDRSNGLWFQTDWHVVPNPRLISYEVVKKLMFALADAFDPLVTHAYPTALDREMMIPQKTLPILAGWMVLLPPQLATRTIPPPTAISQTRPDGSLFMAATDETFDVDNPNHVAVSKAMQVAIAPINDRTLFDPVTAGS